MMSQVLELSEASKLICEEIKAHQNGWSAGKIGTSEFNAIQFFLHRTLSPEQKLEYPPSILREMTQNAGFWNGDLEIHEALDDWAKQMLDAISQLNVVVAWNPSQGQELELINYYNPKAKKVVLRALEPYYTPQHQYTHCMTGKIAVVTPFAKSIQSQWDKMEQIFPENRVWLPKQELIAINAQYGPYMTPNDMSKSWPSDVLSRGINAAIDYLEQEVLKSKAKYAFVGIGCLSLILVSRLKKHGITAIHTGGGTQIMFGVKGKRWANHSIISKMFNSSWVSPLPEEIPSGAGQVEGGCYW